MTPVFSQWCSSLRMSGAYSPRKSRHCKESDSDELNQSCSFHEAASEGIIGIFGFILHNVPCQGRLRSTASGLWARLERHLGVQEGLHAPAAQDDAAPPPTCQGGMLPHPHAHATCMRMAQREQLAEQ